MGKRQNKNMVYVVVIITIISIVALSASGVVQMSWTESTDTGSIFSGTLTAYKDGQPVSEPIVMGSFVKDGVVIDSLVLNLGWVSTGSSVDWNTFTLSGSFVVTRLLWNPDDENFNPRWVSAFSTSFTSTEKDDTWSQTMILGDDICTAASIIDGGWQLQFEIVLTATVMDTIGVELTDSVTFGASANIGYTSDYGLEGYAEW